MNFLNLSNFFKLLCLFYFCVSFPFFPFSFVYGFCCCFLFSSFLYLCISFRWNLFLCFYPFLKSYEEFFKRWKTGYKILYRYNRKKWCSGKLHLTCHNLITCDKLSCVITSCDKLGDLVVKPSRTSLSKLFQTFGCLWTFFSTFFEQKNLFFFLFLCVMFFLFLFPLFSGFVFVSFFLLYFCIFAFLFVVIYFSVLPPFLKSFKKFYEGFQKVWKVTQV